jgi:hypothetical protein
MADDLCICGSGKTYKECHGVSPPPASHLTPTFTVQKITEAQIPQELLLEFQQIQFLEQERVKKFGQVRPEISGDFHGYKFISVGSNRLQRRAAAVGQDEEEFGSVSHSPSAGRGVADWKQQSPDPSPEAFIFADAKGGFMDTGNYRRRVLHKLADGLELPKLTFQVIRRTIATLAQKKGTVKDVQGLLRHSRAATTTDVYMQEIPESVQATINAIHAELKTTPQAVVAG